jgi:hypothetical protein
MRKLLLPLGFLAMMFSCQKEDFDGCIDSTLIREDAACTMDYNPVCGCDGETYANACVAKYFNGVTSYTSGPCTPNSRCEALEEPDLFMSGYEDPVWITSAEIRDGCLHIAYQYSGGCNKHAFKLRIMPIFCGTPPLPPTTLELVHEANGDNCEASLTGFASYDLSRLQDSTHNQVVFYLRERHNGYNKRFVYKY